MSCPQWRPDYRRVFESLPVPVTLVDENGIIVDLNQASIDLARRLGRTICREDRIGHSVTAFGEEPVSDSQLIPLIRAAVRQGEISALRWEHHDRNGTPFWVEFRVGPIPRSGSCSPGAALVRVEITERVRQERFREAQERLREALWRMTSSADMRHLLVALCREFKRLVPYIDGCSLQIRHGDPDSWICYHLSADGGGLVQVEIDATALVEKCWAEQRPMYRSDLEAEDPHGERQAIWDVDKGFSPAVRSVLDLPFRQGTVAVNSRRPDAFGEADIQVLSELIQMLSLGLDRLAAVETLEERNRALEREIARRKRVQAELMSSRTRYQQLVESAPDFVVLFLDLDGTYQYVAPQIGAFTGLTPDQFLEDREIGLQITHPQDLPLTGEAFRRAAATLQQQRVEWRYRHRDGTWHWASETLTPVLTPEGRAVGIQAVLHDITAVKAGEERLQLDVQLQRLRVCSARLKDEEEWIALARTSCEALKGWIPCDSVRIQVLREGGDTLSEWTVEADGRLRRGPDQRISAQRRQALLVLKSQARPVVHPRRDSAGFPADLAPSIQSVLQVPWAAGVFEVRSSRENAFAPRDVDIAGEFAELVGGGYEHVRDQAALNEAHLRFQRAQRMEAVGQLAGGVAHDFNNLLTTMMGYSQLALRDAHLEDLPREAFEQILAAAERGSRLTRQLLAFSRRETIHPESVDLARALPALAKMLGRLLGEHIELSFEVAAQTPPVFFDPGQLDQILINLAVNARDAMPAGGRITVQAGERLVARPEVHDQVTVEPGRYVELTVTDTGTGMDAQVREHIFEPFFTTKDVDRGTGLGLAMVFGAIKQNGGYIWVHSRPGEGTRFVLYLPAAQPGEASGTGAAAGGGAEKSPPAPAAATILVAEDDPAVRNVVVRLLRRAGYCVLAARTGEEALAVAADAEDIDVLIADEIMPGMRGHELAATLQALRPHLRTLLMSGYPNGGTGQAEEDEVEGLPLIRKPFRAEDLLRTVEELAGRPPSGDADGPPSANA